MTIRVIAALLLMAACAPSGEAEKEAAVGVGKGAEEATESGDAPAVMELCDAVDYRPMIGTAVVMDSLPVGRFLRVYGENAIITQEYLPRRTNIVHDAKRVVRDIYCG
jgi:hypothetical protein